MSADKVCREIGDLHPKMQEFVTEALRLIHKHRLPFKLFETIRTVERQKLLVAKGYSKTMRSKHLRGRAVDFVCYIDKKWSWSPKHHFWYDILGLLLIKSLTGVTWGGNWTTFIDRPHYQLDNDIP